MKNKSRIWRMLKDAPEDIKSITVAQLVDKFGKELEAERKAKLSNDDKVCSDFTGVYIKVRDEDATFGLDVDYIRIDSIKPGSMDTEWEQLYDVIGEKVQFSNIKNALRDCNDNMSADELYGAEVITKEIFDHAKTQLELANEIIDKIKA